MQTMKNEYQDSSMSCKNCGGEMHGDGYTSVRICEYAEEPVDVAYEPDAGPIYCNLEEEDSN